MTLTPLRPASALPAVAVEPRAARILRAEGALALGLAALAYQRLGASWGEFALLFLLPDLSMLGYLRGPRVGALAYNLGHTYLSPALLALLGAAAGAAGSVLPLAAIWAAHIGFDRALGYGLKSPAAFGATHLGWRGRPADARAAPARA